MSTSGGSPRILVKEVVAARDGVELLGDVFLPSEDSPRSPTVLVRTPYGRNQTLLWHVASRLRNAGLSVLLQDCRGHGASGGEPDLRLERDDTEATVSWVVSQPWNDGSVGLLGMSISSLQFFPLAASPPAGAKVGAMVNLMGACNLHEMVYRDGALVLHWALPWFHTISSRGSSWQTRPWDQLFRHLPLDSIPDDDFDLRLWHEALAHPAYGEHWKPFDSRPWLSQIDAPTLSISGWQDFMLDQTLQTFEAMSASSPGRHKLIVGPWDHQSLLANFAPSPEAAASGAAIDLTEVVVTWFQRWLLADARGRSAAAAWDRQPGVCFFVLGDGRWIASDRYPISSTRASDLFLASEGDAGAAGDGGRLAAKPGAAASDAFSFDPADPVPTVGGSVWPFPTAGLRPGAADQRQIEERTDVLVYTSDLLPADLVTAGPIEVDLWASTSAANTDFTAKLVDVEPDGTARIVQDGIARTGHSLSAEPRPFEPGRDYAWKIGLPAVAHRFRAGHRLRLEISSSNFPKYDRCVTTADRAGEIHRQRVSHGGSTPSRVRLTVLSEEIEAREFAPLGSPGFQAGAGPGGQPGQGIQAALGRLLRVVMKQFGRPKGFFGLFVGRALAYYNRQLNECALRHLEVQPTDHVLEIGFGPGLSIQRIAEQAPRGRVLGIDHSEVMVRVAGKRNAEGIASGRVELRQSVVEELDEPQGSFDRVLAVNLIQLLPAPVETLTAIRRLLKDGGRLVVARQPRGETESSERLFEMASTIASQVRAAGFVSVQTKIEPAEPIGIACIVATKKGVA